jgi:asparagine synthase (glutamine-hydrolysing)
MCGISGIVKLNNSELQLPALLQQVTHRIKHRGPDGEGFFFANGDNQTAAYGEASPDNVKHAAFAYSPKQAIETVSNNFTLGLGHRRLSILDLTATGHQPMCLPDKKIWITYNGEIYNYIEIREELIAKGHNFLTSSDTEVILKSYEEWGVDCVQKFNGMWAFVIYDEAKQNLFGSRDRFGVKPLYYIHTNSIFAFASEHKALLHDALIKPVKNYAAIFDYFVFSKLENEAEGIFKDIFELKPASNFEFNLTSHRFKIWKYYHLPISNGYEKFSPNRFEELREQTKNLILDAVRLRLRSDVPVGSCLSGGLDSSSIVMMMHSI